ncbi:MAG TPA: phosphoribosylanthranilate isomerase [Candidatus Eisenbacteria bacterium]|nr:phosphoribosylanthranilate isomerase [Candidatus Eisenbacteria bacterium]
MTQVKICGITNLRDAEKALEFGADILGFNFYRQSPRYIDPTRAQAILEQLPGGSFGAALFVNEGPETVRQVLRFGKVGKPARRFGWLQFHGDEDAAYCRGWEVKVIKAFRLQDRRSLEGMLDFPADLYLLDSWSPGYGGSGAPFPWEWLEDVPADRIILSGGLSTENVVQAIRRVRPYGVDVCSSVEARPGVKDHAKLKEFIVAAKRA